MREIGSEFWLQYEPISLENTKNEVYLLSGRTALQFIIDDIFKNKKAKKALLPSYCCESMLQPFFQAGIAVQFYQVGFEQFKYPYSNDADIILLIDYFGYIINQNSEIAYSEKQVGKTIIYDYTHKIDGNPKVEKYADYSFCSYRKWFYCNYAKIIKHCGSFDEDIKLKINESYIKIRDEAAYKKKEYIAGLTKNKEIFLSKFSAAEEILDKDYIGYSGIPVAFELDEIVSKRRTNAKYLLKELKSISELKLWRTEIQLNDTPMFVPIFVDSTVRDRLRRKLIVEEIYCPIHWPKTIYHVNCNDVYDRELSLVCDQRYDIKDMERIIHVIKEFFSK